MLAEHLRDSRPRGSVTGPPPPPVNPRQPPCPAQRPSPRIRRGAQGRRVARSAVSLCPSYLVTPHPQPALTPHVTRTALPPPLTPPPPLSNCWPGRVPVRGAGALRSGATCGGQTNDQFLRPHPAAPRSSAALTTAGSSQRPAAQHRSHPATPGLAWPGTAHQSQNQSRDDFTWDDFSRPDGSGVSDRGSGEGGGGRRAGGLCGRCVCMGLVGGMCSSAGECNVRTVSHRRACP